MAQKSYKEKIVRKYLDGKISKGVMTSMLDVFEDNHSKKECDIAYW